MNRKIFNYLEIAAQAAVSKVDPRNFLLGAVAIRSDGAIVKALNSPSETPQYSLHAEFRLSRKLDVGSVVYVARIRLDSGEWGLSRPCFSCMKALKNKGVRRIYYTVSPGAYMVLDEQAIKNFTKAEYLSLRPSRH
jgi:tRNA(Arg) A34 adenosine deaminase TadA